MQMDTNTQKRAVDLAISNMGQDLNAFAGPCRLLFYCLKEKLCQI